MSKNLATKQKNMTPRSNKSVVCDCSSIAHPLTFAKDAANWRSCDIGEWMRWMRGEVGEGARGEGAARRGRLRPRRAARNKWSGPGSNSLPQLGHAASHTPTRAVITSSSRTRVSYLYLYLFTYKIVPVTHLNVSNPREAIRLTSDSEFNIWPWRVQRALYPFSPFGSTWVRY